MSKIIGSRFGNSEVVDSKPKTRDGSMVQLTLGDQAKMTMPAETAERCNYGGRVHSFANIPFETEADRRRKAKQNGS